MVPDESKCFASMTYDQRMFLSCRLFPALITDLETGWILGLEVHQIDILVTERKIIPAGNNWEGKGRLFITAYILELADDRDWINNAKDTLSRHWEVNNASRRSKPKRESKRQKEPQGR